MPSPDQDDYNAFLRDINDLVEAFGDEVVDQISDETEGGDPINGYQCSHGDNPFNVYGIWDGTIKYWTVEFGYNALQQYAIRREVENLAGPISDGLEIEPDIDAARAELNREAEENSEPYQNLVANLREEIKSPHSSFQVDMTENGALKGFAVRRKIFPYEDSFDISDFSQAVQIVISNGLPGARLVDDAYNISEALQEARQPAVEATDDTDLHYIG